MELPVPSARRYRTQSQATLSGGHICLVLTPNGENQNFRRGRPVIQCFRRACPCSHFLFLRRPHCRPPSALRFGHSSACCSAHPSFPPWRCCDALGRRRKHGAQLLDLAIYLPLLFLKAQNGGSHNFFVKSFHWHFVFNILASHSDTDVTCGYARNSIMAVRLDTRRSRLASFFETEGVQWTQEGFRARYTVVHRPTSEDANRRPISG